MSSMGTSGFVLSQLGYSAPALLVYLVAFILAIVFRRQAPGASNFTLAGVAILVFGTLAGIAGQTYLLQSIASGSGSSWTSQMMGIVGFGAICVRAVGLSLLVAAIFVGRGRSSRPYVRSETPLEDDPRRSNEGEAGRFRERRES